MMKHMMLFYPFHKRTFEIIMMHGIMHHIVRQVTGNKTGIERIKQGLICKQQKKTKNKNRSPAECWQKAASPAALHLSGNRGVRHGI